MITALDVRCPTCASAPGTPCYDGAAPKPSHLFHQARISLAAETEDADAE